MLSLLSLRTPEKYSSLPLLGDVLDGLCDWLQGQGYPPQAIRRRVLGSPLVADALLRKGVGSFRELTAAELRSLAPKPTYWTAQLACSLVNSLTRYFQERGELAPAATTPGKDRAAAYCQYVRNVRGLAARSVARQSETVVRFLDSLGYDTRPQSLRELTGVDLEVFLRQEARCRGRVGMQKVTATLRSFLRWLAAEGQGPPGLDSQVDSPRCFRGERLPRALPWESVRLLLRSVDRTTPKGRRDYAMLLMIATYGLRVSEIASLKIDDVSWRSRRIRLQRPKVGHPLALPLTDEVAAALLDYLRRDRPVSAHRHLFLRVRIPSGPVKSTAVCDVFDAWATRAGIRLPLRGGPHCLRHSLAVRLLRQGASVKSIGDLLGHRSAESTGVYLRLQVDELRDVALPLPPVVGPVVPP